MVNNMREKIERWFKARFKQEAKGNYYGEWLSRFDQGEEYALRCMDNESKRMWEEMK